MNSGRLLGPSQRLPSTVMVRMMKKAVEGSLSNQKSYAARECLWTSGPYLPYTEDGLRPGPRVLVTCLLVLGLRPSEISVSCGR